MSFTRPEPTPTSVLCGYLGNIGRRPLAKWISQEIVRRNQHADRFEINSCGTGGWHVGESADPRSVAVARRLGLSTSGTVRQFARPTQCEIRWATTYG